MMDNELFIKILPDYKRYSIDDILNIDVCIGAIDILKQKYPNNIMIDIVSQNIDTLRGKLIEDYILDYSKNKLFWKYITYNNKNYMLAHDINLYIEEYNKDEISKQFISLSDFLNKGIIIGKKFTRINPISIYDTTCYKTKVLGLYMYKNHMLSLLNGDYFILTPEYFSDNSYEFLDDIDDILLDKKYIHQKILKRYN